MRSDRHFFLERTVKGDNILLAVGSSYMKVYKVLETQSSVEAQLAVYYIDTVTTNAG